MVIRLPLTNMLNIFTVYNINIQYVNLEQTVTKELYKFSTSVILRVRSTKLLIYYLIYYDYSYNSFTREQVGAGS